MAKQNVHTKGNKKSRAKQVAYDLFMESEYSQNEIAEIAGVQPNTISRWKLEGNWEELKTVQSVSTKKLQHSTLRMIAKLDEQIRENEDGIPNIKQADMRRKLIKDLQELEGTKSTVLDYMNNISDFIIWIKDNHDTDLAINTLKPFLKSFLAYKYKMQ